jgi:Predicted AAA-ATPase/PD-(D/E)XK nuclease superfamily
MKIPYGKSNFGDIRRGGYFYVDKTPFLAELENAEFGFSNLVFLRPRRMGKSSLVSMMAHYYDISLADQFDELFGGLWVHEHPTPEKNAHIVFHLNLGSVRGNNEAEVKAGFAACIRHAMKETLQRYESYADDLGAMQRRLVSVSEPVEMLYEMMGVATTIRKRLYVIIDEYDTFANGLIAAGNKRVYESLTEQTGFVRHFYAALKAGTEIAGIARIFLTGVSPMLLDDLYTGFNIATNITTNARFHALAGFTRSDVERALDELLVRRPQVLRDARIVDRTALFDVLQRSFDGYRFSTDATERLFNSDMVLYFLREVAMHGRYPSTLLDPNARTDYQKFYGLYQVAGPVGEDRRRVIETILEEGGILGALIETFGRTPTPPPREQLISLLFYTGMLTLSTDEPIGWLYRFEIPNLVIRDLNWEHFASMLKTATGVEMQIPELALAQSSMAMQGDIRPFVQAIHERIMKVLGNKDLQHFGEKSVKMILITSAIIAGIFHVLSEKEFHQGYCDLFWSPRREISLAKYSWLMELKYLPTTAMADDVAKAFSQAHAQLHHYATDKELVPILTERYALKAVALVFVGLKEIHAQMFDIQALVPEGSVHVATSE